MFLFATGTVIVVIALRLHHANIIRLLYCKLHFGKLYISDNPDLIGLFAHTRNEIVVAFTALNS